MFHKGLYKNKTEQVIRKEVVKEGFDPIKIHNAAGYIYPPHHHPEKNCWYF